LHGPLILALKSADDARRWPDAEVDECPDDFRFLGYSGLVVLTASLSESDPNLTLSRMTMLGAANSWSRRVSFWPDSGVAECADDFRFLGYSGRVVLTPSLSESLSRDPYRYVFRLVYRRATLSPRDVARILLTRSTMTFMAAPRTSAQRAAFDTVSIAPSMSTPCTTLPTTMTAARTI
jgi:hypothetical protein